MKYILALDQGTTSSRALLLGEDGRVHALAQRPLEQIFPQPGWVEHDPFEIWSSQLAVAEEALAAADVDHASLAAIGITNQRETTILWDRRTSEPVANAIGWQDRRTSAYCDQLRAAGHEKLIQNTTGLVIDAYFSASKIRWMLDNIPGVKERAARGKLAFGTVDSWLIWKLTGGAKHVTDVTNASRTMLLNLRTLEWHRDLLSLFDVPASLLPEIVDSSGTCAVAAGVLEGVPIAGIAGDQQAALFGQMCTEPGMAKCTYGTGAFMLLNTGSQPVISQNKLLATAAWRIGGRASYALEGSIFIAGAVVQWLRDELQIIRKAEDIEALAASVPDSHGVYLVPAFSGLGAPHWDQYARGLIIGLTRGVNRAHIARAALEGIAFQVADVLQAMQSDSGIALQELRVDGGAARNDLLLQLQADLLGIPVTRPSNPETTALGAAYLAGLATRFWPDHEVIRQQSTCDRQFTPAISESDRTRQRADWARALERARNWEPQ